ncbi:MAG: hypothetical protein D6681_20055 [Calditrichaeota bacterium]|nr:MAG: hypothetical protein D6681_20055 [Calditrichota bacterium]
MPGPPGVPELSVEEVAERLQSNPELIVLDVREPEEVALVQLPHPNVEVVPLSVLIRQGIQALPESVQDRNREIIIMCHHGIRSAQVVLWLQQNGWTKVINMAGGIDAYARRVDASIGIY